MKVIYNRVIKKPFAGVLNIAIVMLCMIFIVLFSCVKQNPVLVDNGEEPIENSDEKVNIEPCKTTITGFQITPCIKSASLTEDEKDYFERHFNIKKCTAFTMDIKELAGYIDGIGGKFQFRLRIDEELDWIIDLEYNDMYVGPSAENTFKGKTSEGQIVRFIIDEDKFSGIIFYDKYQYFIQPVHGYGTISLDDRIMVYSSLDFEEYRIQSTGFCMNPFLSSFIKNVSKYSENDSVYVIKGLALDEYEYGRKIRLIEDLKGNFPANVTEFIAWGDGFGVIESARFNHLARDYDKQDVLIMILTTYDYRLASLWEALKHESVLGVPFFENSGDYRTIGCTYSAVLKLSDDYVTGGGSQIFTWMNYEMIVHWSEFYEILREVLKSNK